jgi:hypothetical protein
MKLSSIVSPIQAAIEKLGAKTPIVSVLRSAEWADVPLGLRERAQFSARVESARVMQTIQDKMMSAISMKREKVAHGEAFVDRSSFIGDLRKVVQEEGLGTGTGTITDISSRARLGLIYDTQLAQAQGFARYKSDMTPIILDMWPAQEFLRLQERRAPRNWTSRWEEAGGIFVAGSRMIALKTDPVWVNLSVFGVPWPPFDFGSGMGLKDVSRADAVEYGLLEKGETIQPTDAKFNDDLWASTENLSPEILSALKTIFGDQIIIDPAEGSVSWKGGAS